MLDFDIHISDRRGSHPSLPHPAVGLSIGRVDWDPVIFYKSEATVPVALWGRTHTIMGISPGSVAQRSAVNVE